MTSFHSSRNNSSRSDSNSHPLSLFSSIYSSLSNMFSLSKRTRFLLISFISVFFYLYSIFTRMGHQNMESHFQQQDGSMGPLTSLLSQLASSPNSIFPLSDAKDTSIQFELLAQVNGVTTVGRPVSVTVRNTPQDRRRMFGIHL
mmetsp:Transcript_9348/g.34623  ORF Transcript_9348/g.34623 Transcript_9348/m.34623 type:complete len:144 (-) Transcript_9348:849-1280(-)